MTTYGVAGLRLTTDVRLPQLPVAPDDHQGPEWRLVPAAPQAGPPLDATFERRTLDGRVWSTVAHGDGRFELDFPERANFTVQLDERLVELTVAPGLPDETLQHLVVDQLVPHVLAAGGALVLHASAVVLDGVAVAFVAPSGSGKSSLAAALVADGAELLTDDYLVLEAGAPGYEVTPAYPGLRLWEDSADHFTGAAEDLATVADYHSKRRWALDESAAAPGVPLGCVIGLGHEPAADQPDIRIGAVRGRQAFWLLFGQTFRVERPGAVGQARELDRFVELCDHVPVLLMEYRRDFALLPDVVARVRSAVRSVGATTA